MSGDDSSLSLRAPARETAFRPFPLASPSGALYIERMFFLRRCINKSVRYLRLYRSLYSNMWKCGRPRCHRQTASARNLEGLSAYMCCGYLAERDVDKLEGNRALVPRG